MVVQLVKNPHAMQESDPCSVPESQSSPGEGMGQPLQYSWASLVAQMVKNLSACNARDRGLIPGLGRFPEGGNGNPLQYSCLENPTDRGACRATVCRVAKSDMTERLSTAQSSATVRNAIKEEDRTR